MKSTIEELTARIAELTSAGLLLSEECLEQEARIKELEEETSAHLTLIQEKIKQIEHLEATLRQTREEWAKEADYGRHLEAELKAVKYCAHCHEAQTDVCPAIKKDQGASESKSLEIDIAGVRCFSCGSKAEEGDCVYLTPKGFSCPVCLGKGGF